MKFSTAPSTPADRAGDTAMTGADAVAAPNETDVGSEGGQRSPTPPPRSLTFIGLYAVATFGLWLAVYAPALVTLGIRVRELSGSGAATDYGMVVAVGALFAMVGNPLFGMLSDRSRSRFGRRRPYFVGGMVVGLAAVTVIGLAPSVPFILVAWCVAQLAYNAAIAAVIAVLPDHFPPAQRGKVSGISGVCNYSSMAVAAYVASWFASSTAMMFIAPAVIGLVMVLAFTPMLTETRRTEPAPRLTVAGFLRTFWIDPRTHQDFAWAWASRFLITLAWMTLLTYQSFLIIDRFDITNTEVAQALTTSSLVMVAGIVTGAGVSGWLSDRLRRRKIFVMTSGAIAAIGFPIVAFSNELGTFLVGVLIVGLGIGVHMAVDLALVTDILPNPAEAAKDLGVFNIANALPQSVAPLVAAALFALVGADSYTVLYLFAAMAAVLGGLIVLAVKGSR